MADVNDVQGYSTKFDNQRQKLRDSSSLDDRDRAAIDEWVVHLRTNDNQINSLGTVVSHLNHIRLAAERSELPLVEFDGIDDVSRLELFLSDEHGIAESTLRNYKKSLRKFFRWRGVEWADDISIGAPVVNRHDPDEEITDDELDALLDACTEFNTPARDKALIAILRDTGLRVGAVLSLRVGDLTVTEDRAVVSINTNANVKGASGKRPLTWSRGYVANWLDVHPRPETEDAALIHVQSNDPDDGGALRQQYAGVRLSKIAEAAGIDSDRIHAHLFRGTAISNWIRDGASDQEIKHRATLVEDSRVLKRYSLVSDEEMNEKILRDRGLVEEDGDSGPSLEQCPQCRTPLRGSERFCPGCATPLSQAAADDAATTEDELFESMAGVSDRNADLIRELRRRFETDAEFRDLLTGHSDSS